MITIEFLITSLIVVLIPGAGVASSQSPEAWSKAAEQVCSQPLVGPRESCIMC